MMGLKKRNKPKESTNVQIKLNVTVSDTENSNSCNIVDSLLNDIWNIALEKEGVEAQSMSSKYMKEKVTTQVETSFKNIEKTLKDNGLYEAYDDMVLIKQALIERDRKIYGLQQHNRNLEDKLGRIGGYHYGNPKQ